jgi:hypothetical protein
MNVVMFRKRGLKQGQTGHWFGNSIVDSHRLLRHTERPVKNESLINTNCYLQAIAAPKLTGFLISASFSLKTQRSKDSSGDG